MSLNLVLLFSADKNVHNYSFFFPICILYSIYTSNDPSVSYARLEKDKGADSEQDVTVTFNPKDEQEKVDMCQVDDIKS